MISVVIPLYNKAAYIARALNSVMSQTFGDYEVIIVNDGSTDNGPEIVRQLWDPRIRLIDQENGGVSAARNRGIGEAAGDLIAFLDADDEWDPRFLSTIARLQEKYPQSGAFATAYYWGSNRNKAKLRNIPSRPDDWNGIIEDFFVLRSGTINSSVTVIRKSVFNRVGNFRVGVRMGEDLDMWIRVAAYYPIAYSNRALATRHYDDPNSACKKILPELDSPYAKTLEMIEQDNLLNAVVKRQVRMYIARQQLIEVEDCYRKGRQDIAIKLLCKWKNSYGLLSLKWVMLSAFVRVSPTIFLMLRSLKAKPGP